MTTRLPTLKSLLILCLAVDAALLGGWVLLDADWFTRPGLRTETLLPAAGFLASSALGVVLTVLIVRRREAAAANLEARFRSLLDAAPDPIVIINGDGLVTLVNARAEQLFGYPRAELVGKPVDDLLRSGSPAADPLRSVPGPAGSSAPAEGQEPELRARRSDGASVPVEISFSPLQTSAGTLTISIVRDITARQAAERLRGARHAVRRILADEAGLAQAAPRLLEAVCAALQFDAAVLWTVDAQAGALRPGPGWQGPAAKGAAGPPAGRAATCARGAGLPGRAWSAAAPVWGADPNEDTAAQPAAPVPRPALAFPVAFGAEVLGVIECLGREPRQPDEALCETLQSIGSQVGRFLKHTQAEEAVRASEARKAAILEAALDPIITVDHTGQVLEFNPAAERLLGIARADAVGQDMAQSVVASGSRDAYRQALAACAGPHAGPAAGRRLELTLARAGGGEVPVELAVARIRADGPPMFTCYVRDLSERKQAEVALRRAEDQFHQSQKMEAVGRLAGGVAHDFNNLLTVINGYTQVLLTRLPAGDRVRGPVELINKAGNRAAGLTRQLLAFSRRQVLEPKVFNLNAAVVDLGKMLQRLIGEDVELTTLPAADLRPIKADLGRIEQVVMNLAVNARDAMPKGGRLTIETRNVELDDGYARNHPEVSPGPFVLLAISDTGCGMDEATKARLVEPFFTTKEVGKGTGLGLATVYGIVKQSGGHVAVYSEPGHGSTFKVYLPCAEEKPVAASLPSPRQAAPKGKGTVLLVEDEDMVRTLSRQILQEQGYTVLEARHGKEAMQLSEQAMDAVRLTVTDVVMPEMDGRDLAQRLLRRRPDMKVLYVSGYTDNAVIRNGLLAPGAAFLEKPFTPERLAHKVHEVLNA